MERKEITAPIPLAIFDMQAQSYPLHPWNGHEQNPYQAVVFVFSDMHEGRCGRAREPPRLSQGDAEH